MTINYDELHKKFYDATEELFDNILNDLYLHYEIGNCDLSYEQANKRDEIVNSFADDATDLAIALVEQNTPKEPSRIDRIKAVALARDKAEQQKKAAQDEEREQLMAKIRAMGDEISEVIKIGNTLLENGFLEYNRFHHEDTRLKKYGYEHSMIAEGICHHVGFMLDREHGRVSYLGIINGGACGVYDFITNGDTMFSEHEKTKNYTAPRNGDLARFIVEFPKFKNALYAWIDNNMN